MGLLTNLFKNKIKFPAVNIKEVFKTSQIANAYVSNNFRKIEKKITRKGNYKSIKFRENNDYSLLHQSIYDGNRNVFDLVLKQKWIKDSDVIDENDNTTGLAPLHLACSKDDVEMLKDLLNVGGNFDVRTKYDDMNALHVAGQYGSVRCADYLLNNCYKSNANCLTSEGWTPLHFSCFMNRLDVSSLLIDNGSDLYIRNKQYLTPLEASILGDNFEIFYSLLNFHYDYDKLNSFDHPESAKLTHVAASCKKGTRILEYLLTDPNLRNEICNTSIRASPLHFACIQNNLNAVKLLIRRDAEINIVDYLGNTPIIYAAERGYLDILKFLIESGADPLKKNKEGLNAIRLAVMSDNRDVKMLFLGTEKFKGIIEKELM